MKKGIAFFDFDGTITTKDTMLELIKHYHGPAKFYLGLIALSPYLLLMKIGLISNHAAKEKMLTYFFGGLEETKFRQVCEGFLQNRLPSLIRPAAMDAILALQKENIEVVIVSASAQNWVKSWCDRQNISLVSSCLEVKNGAITGRLKGKNCHGLEKVKRIKENYRLSDYEIIKCFGDTMGDKPMLSLGTHAFYKPFR